MRFAINFIFDKKIVKKETQYFEKRIFYHKLSSFFKCEVVIKKTLFLGRGYYHIHMYGLYSF